MSNYPPGRSRFHKVVDFICDCGQQWQAPAVSELGDTRLLIETDSLCPDCGRDMDAQT